MIREVGRGGLVASNRHRRDRCRTAAPHPRGHRRWVAETPDHVALVEDGASWTYRELDRHVAEVAAVLASLGIRAGDRMIIVSENCIALAALLLAASRIDAWAIVANPRLSPRELDQIRDHSGARRMFFTSAVSKEAAAHASRCHAESRSIGPSPSIGVTALNERAIAEPAEQDAAKQVAVLIYTSGTTGTPKGVMLTHDNLLISAKTTAHFRRMDADDKIYIVLPISHIVGFSLLIMTLMVGATSTSSPATSRRRWRRRSPKRESPSSTACPPPISACWNTRPWRASSSWPRVAAAARGGRRAARPRLEGACRARVRAAAAQRLRHHRMLAGHFRRALRCTAQRQPVGTLLPGIEVRPVDRDGVPVANGEVGELHVRGPNVMRGYYRAPDVTATAIDPRRLVQYRRSRALRRRCALHRRPHQGTDHPFGLQRLSGRGRGGAQFASVGRAVGGGRPRRQRQRGGRGLRAAAAGRATSFSRSDGALSARI